MVDYGTFIVNMCIWIHTWTLELRHKQDAVFLDDKKSPSLLQPAVRFTAEF
jgi:hypothetical protein